MNTHRALAVLVGLATLSILFSGPAAAETCGELETNNKRHPCKPWFASKHNAALETMNAAEAHRKYRGQGTAVVHIEPEIPWLKALDATSSKPLFGDCSLPKDGLNPANLSFLAE